MSLLVLIALVLVLAALVASAASRFPVPGLPVVATGAILCVMALLGGGHLAALPVPFGLVGSSGGLQLDALSGPFLVLAFLVACFAEALPPAGMRELSMLRLGLAGTVLAMLAGDVFLLAVGGMLAILALGAGIAARGPALIACCSLAGCCALLAGMAAPPTALLPDVGFALLRPDPALPVAGFGRAVLTPVLALGAVAPLLGLWPAQRWHRRVCVSRPAAAPILAALLGLFLLLRLLLDLADASSSAIGGTLLLLAGLGGALRAGIAALGAPRLRPAIGSLLAVQTGLVAAALGSGLLAHAQPLPVPPGPGVQAALLLGVVQLPSVLVLLALAHAVETEAGAGLLSRLGGLAQSMPRAALLGAAGVAILGFLPPAGGFSGLWLLVQQLLALSHGGRGWAGLSVLAVLVTTVVAGVSALGWLRLAAAAFLGRPRTPRGAAAQDLAIRPLRVCLAMLALPVLAGLLPGVALRLVAPLLSLLRVGDAVPGVMPGLISPAGGSDLSPLPLLSLMLLGFGFCLWAVRRLRVRSERRGPAWEDGVAPPPPWLPFGDPLLQAGPTLMVRLLKAELGMPSRLALQLPVAISPRQVRARLRRSALKLTVLLQMQGGALAIGLLVLLLAFCAWRGVA